MLPLLPPNSVVSCSAVVAPAARSASHPGPRARESFLYSSPPVTVTCRSESAGTASARQQARPASSCSAAPGYPKVVAVAVAVVAWEVVVVAVMSGLVPGL